MYPYLYWSVLFGLIWLLLFIARPDLRKEMLTVGLLLMPFGLTNFMFIPEYWDPKVIVKVFGIFDIESLLHLFFLGGIASTIYELIFRYKHAPYSSNAMGASVKLDRKIYGVYASIILLIVYMFLIQHFTDFSIVRSNYAYILLCLGLFAHYYKHLWREAFYASLFLTILYISSLLLIDFITGGFLNQWNTEHSLLMIGHLPIEEFVYAILLGVVGSTLYDGLGRLRLVRKLT